MGKENQFLWIKAVFFKLGLIHPWGRSVPPSARSWEVVSLMLIPDIWFWSASSHVDRDWTLGREHTVEYNVVHSTKKYLKLMLLSNNVTTINLIKKCKNQTK